MNAQKNVRQKLLKYLSSKHRGGTVDYPIQAMQRALEAQGVPSVFNDYGFLQFTGKAFRKLGLIRNLVQVSNYAYFAPIMQVSAHRLFPQCYWAETISYCFDCWPAKYDQWEAFFRKQRMRITFISARQSAERMRDRVPGLDAIWMPEGIELTRYIPNKPLTMRGIDILELGRRWSIYHDRITPHCKSRGYSHKYESQPGTLVFPTEAEFYQGMANAKISICFPSSLTHPARSGDVETLTLRYLESMACRSIVVGRCPAELKDLFGYDPVIEADLSDPGGQLDYILSRLRDYDTLLDQNLQRLRKVGTWDARVYTIIQILQDRGYEALSS